MYPVSDWSSFSLRTIMDISARATSLAERPRRGPFGSPVFACAGKTDPPSRLILSQTSAGKGCWLDHRDCSVFWSVPLFVPRGRSFVPTCACRRVVRRGSQGWPSQWPCHLACALRPRLDGPEHGARIKWVGPTTHRSWRIRRRALCGEPPRRCGRACWQARSPARCGAVASWLPRSTT